MDPSGEMESSPTEFLLVSNKGKSHNLKDAMFFFGGVALVNNDMLFFVVSTP